MVLTSVNGFIRRDKKKKRQISVSWLQLNSAKTKREIIQNTKVQENIIGISGNLLYRKKRIKVLRILYR